jgi:hypothetical protein
VLLRPSTNSAAAVIFGSEADLTDVDVDPTHPGRTGILATGRSTVDIHRSHIVARTRALDVANGPYTEPNRVDAWDTLIESTGSGATTGFEAVTVTSDMDGPAELGLYRSTVAAHGAYAKNALFVRSTTPGDSALADIRGSALVVEGSGDAGREEIAVVEQGGTATVTAARSAYGLADAAGGAEVAPGTIPATFADFAGRDYTPTSALADAGDGDGLTADALDVNGSPRVLDGDGICGAAVDIGAVERPAAAPAGPCPGTSTPPGEMSPGGGDIIGERPGEMPPPLRDMIAPRVTGLSLAKRVTIRPRGTTSLALKLTLSEPAAVTAYVERRAGRRWKRVTKPVTRQLPAGARRLSLALGKKSKLTRGRHRVVVRAVDAAGNRSPFARPGFSLRAAR